MKSSIIILSFFTAFVFGDVTLPALSGLGANPPSECLALCVAGALQSQIALTIPNPCINSTLSQGFSECVIGEKCREQNVASLWTSICQVVVAELRVPFAQNNATIPTPTLGNIDTTGTTVTSDPTNANERPAAEVDAQNGSSNSRIENIALGILSVLLTWAMFV